MYCVNSKKMCVALFGSNSPKMSVLFYMNSDKKCLMFLCGITSLKVSMLFCMNSDKKCVVLFCINSLTVSKLFHMKSKIIQF